MKKVHPSKVHPPKKTTHQLKALITVVETIDGLQTWLFLNGDRKPPKAPDHIFGGIPWKTIDNKVFDHIKKRNTQSK